MKKPSGKRPALFMQWGDIKLFDVYKTLWPKDKHIHADVTKAHRLRIVYPDGKIEWFSFEDLNKEGDYEWCKPPCYVGDCACYGVKEPPNNFKDAIRLIRRYDESYDFKPMVFIGEL